MIWVFSSFFNAEYNSFCRLHFQSFKRSTIFKQNRLGLLIHSHAGVTVKLFYNASFNTFPSSVLPDSTVALQSLPFLLQFYLLWLAHPSVPISTTCAYTCFDKAHISMVSNTTVSCNTKSSATHTLNQLCSQDSGAIKEPGTAPFKSYVLCSQSQTLPTSESMGTLSFLPCATL